VGDVISEVRFWLILSGLGSNHQAEVFRSSFHWKLVGQEKVGNMGLSFLENLTCLWVILHSITIIFVNF